MSFKCLPKDVTGEIEIYRFGTFYRLTSCVYALGLQNMDLDHGLDEFLPTTVSDAEFGAAIRRFHDATRFEELQPQSREALKAEDREWKKKLVLWDRKALKMTGCKNLSQLFEEGAKHSSSSRTKDVYVFFNSSQNKPTSFSSIPARYPDYREFIVKQPASDEMLGQAARAALDAGVLHALPPAPWD
ncbi:hypothetical protein [Verminephrobacter aporrectodeae]|uniref:hypothetical protein n=1 Tax=Verminephrobacter aporrectodeae TaxID=1110389 RepID=UPI002244D1FF|nr:hypothetical protein [Verminephrobacter aporrectodeae]MCW8174224.1 hypothetical protein [Verminephrobacter aporrectodeae subsp. tuberculatae]MCW8201924.1 hypothetical protein [Verminephrobacter aporrectodeae subsp. tuberculatae]MCW8208223.1 hypothetical protein [Verminephrobacter aporrectodeae subsp. tuberculatae]